MVDQIDISGFKMRFVQSGTGESVVFVHGALVDHRSWNEHIHNVGQTYKAIAMDLRYCGSAEWPDDGGNFSIQTHADDLATFIRDTEKKPVTLVGWSYGGAVALVAAIRNPELIRNMFLYEPSLATFLTDADDIATISEDRADMMMNGMKLVASGDLAAATRTLVEAINRDPGMFDRLPKSVRSMLLENARTLPLMATAVPPPSITAEDLKQLELPVKVVVGAQTRVFYKTVASELAKLLPSGQLQIIDDAKHFWPADKPNDFTRHLLDFLSRN